MNREQAKDILAKVHLLYPMFNRENSEELAIIWLDQLEKSDYEKSKQMLMDYTLGNKYPPTIADIFSKDVKEKSNKQIELEEMEAAVRKEKADPELEAKRLKSIEAMQRKLRGMGAIE